MISVMANINMTVYLPNSDSEFSDNLIPSLSKQKVFHTNPMTYAAIFGHGTNPGRPIKGSRINYPLWARQYTELGLEGILLIPNNPSIKVTVIGVYTPIKWRFLMRSCPHGRMKIVDPNTNEYPSHGCILEVN
jgi:hypothetical protein